MPGLESRIQFPRPLLPPNRYAEIMQIPLPHFNQMGGALAPLNDGCDDIWDQNDRDELVWALEQAEQYIADYLRYYPAPKFVTNEEVQIGLHGSRSDWWNAGLSTEYGYVQGFGTETLTLKEPDVPILYENKNNNPFDDRPTLATLVVGGLYSQIDACDSACDVAVFFREEDGAEDAADARWEVRPIKVDIDDNIMYIKINPAYLVKPTIWGLNRQECLGSDDENAWIADFDVDNLVTHVDIYCRTINTTLPLTLKWDGYCHCASPCSHQTQTGCALQTNMKLGHFQARPATGTNQLASISSNVSGPPLFASVNYYGGYPLDRYCRMNERLERAIVKLANTLMPEPQCGFCDLADTKWRSDRENIDPLTPESANMPWDLYTQGALDAWRVVKRMALGSGGKMGR